MKPLSRRSFVRQIRPVPPPRPDDFPAVARSGGQGFTALAARGTRVLDGCEHGGRMEGDGECELGGNRSNGCLLEKIRRLERASKAQFQMRRMLTNKTLHSYRFSGDRLRMPL